MTSIHFFCLSCRQRLDSVADAYRCPGCRRMYGRRDGHWNFVDPALDETKREEKKQEYGRWRTALRQIGWLRGMVRGFFAIANRMQFDAIDAPAGRDLVRRKFSFLKDSDKIFEGGCAGGRNVLSLVNAGYDVVGCDIQPYPETWGKRPERFFLGSIYSVPFPDGYFDVVISHAILEHVEDDLQALNELKRVCRPGGRVSIEVPQFTFYNRWSKRCKDPTHYREYTKEGVEALVERAGLKIVSYSAYGFVAPVLVRTINFWLYMLPLIFGRGVQGQRTFMETLGRLLPQRQRANLSLCLEV